MTEDERERLIRDLLTDVMQSHADPQDPGYNGCDPSGEQCAWCEDAAKVLGAPTVPQSGTPERRLLNKLLVCATWEEFAEARREVSAALASTPPAAERRGPVPNGVDHHCGLSGWNPVTDEPCPACRRRQEGYERDQEGQRDG